MASDASTRRLDVRVLHSSDLHISSEEQLPTKLSGVLAAARTHEVDLLVLAGDIFDNHRVPVSALAAARNALEAAVHPTVILPGNHDRLGPGTCYERLNFRASRKVTVLGLQQDSVLFPTITMEVMGAPHTDDTGRYHLKNSGSKRTAWRIFLAHGHFTSRDDEHYSWPIRASDLATTEADYVALGHWDHCVPVSRTPQAWYSGAPDHATTANLVCFSDGEGISVQPVPLR